MIKIASIFAINILGIFSFLNVLFNDVSIIAVMPDKVIAGDEIIVEFTIDKGNISGFARFQQELPNGFTAIEKVSANGDFRFSNQKVNLTWFNLPYSNEVIISYIVQVAPTISGTFNFGGTFSYIFNNQVSTIDVPVKTIIVEPGDLANNDLQVGTTSLKYGNINLREVDCVRQKPFLNDNNEVIVNILVNKGDRNQFGKIEEQVPLGYIASSEISRNAIFSFKNHRVKFLWMNLPPEDQFTISYKLVPENEIPDQAFIITGTFSYVDNDRNKIIDIVERNIDISIFDADKLVAEVKSTDDTNTETITDNTSDYFADNTTQTDVVENNENNNQSDISNDAKENDNNDILADGGNANINTDNISNDVQSDNVSESSDNSDINSGNYVNLTNVPEPEAGIAFRVQIAAGHKLVANKYFRKLNIKDHIQTEIHDGWHKYTVGSFPEYVEARDYRVYIWNTTPVKDAFVSAYNNGQRLTVQEAMMITNQKWYK